MPDETAQKVVQLQTEFKNFRNEQDRRDDDRGKRVNAIFIKMDEIAKHLYTLPCKVHAEKLSVISTNHLALNNRNNAQPCEDHEIKIETIGNKVETMRKLSWIILGAIVAGFVTMLRVKGV